MSHISISLGVFWLSECDIIVTIAFLRVFKKVSPRFFGTMRLNVKHVSCFSRRFRRKSRLLRWLVFFVSSTRNVHFLCINAHLPTFTIWLSTSFSTHPKPLRWDEKPFQSRRVHFFWHYETFLLFSALWDWSLPRQTGKFWLQQICCSVVWILHFDYNTWVFKKWGKWSGTLSWILALIPCVTCEESPKQNFHCFPEFLKFCGFFISAIISNH